MNDQIGSSLLDQNVQVKPEILLGTLLLSFILGLLISFCYKRTHKGVSYSRSLPLALLMIPIIVSVVLMAIGSSIALSLGLVGSLSILRFRTAIRDIRDMVYLFITIAAGLSCGSGNYTLAITGSVFLIVTALVFERISWFSRVLDDYLITLELPSNHNFTYSKLESELKQFCQRIEMKSAIDAFDSSEYTISVSVKSGVSGSEILSCVRGNCSKDTVIRVVAPDSTVLF